jgi:exosortase
LAIGFLVFMIPFPYRLETALSDPLQKLATLASCYLLQTLGQIAVAEGNVIQLESGAIEVVQACNGLRMSVSFLAISVAVAMLIQRKTWEKVLVIVSAVPIALICNVLRITITGYLSSWFSPHAGQLFFHDIAGWLMMPMALALLSVELWLITFLLTDPDDGPVPVASMSSPAGVRPLPGGGPSKVSAFRFWRLFRSSKQR